MYLSCAIHRHYFSFGDNVDLKYLYSHPSVSSCSSYRNICHQLTPLFVTMLRITLLTLFVFFLTLFAYLYRRFKKSRNYFKDAGIPHIEPHWLLGSMKDSALLKKHFVIEFAELYHKLEPLRFAGFYLFFQPGFIIRDPELVKRILVKDFSYFINHGFPTSKDELFGSNNLLFMEGEEWKNLRIKLTGTFTTGKIKMMFPLVKKCAEDIKPALMEHVLSADGLEMKDLCARYMTDVISSCVFGIDTRSLKHPDSEFRMMGKRILEFRWQSVVRNFFPNIPKWCVELFGLQLFDKKVTDYFVKSVLDVVKFREENNVNRGDFLDLLIALKNHTDAEKLKDSKDYPNSADFIDQLESKCNKNDVEMTNEKIAAQCFLFFFGGFEGTSISLSLLLFELAQNHDIQNKVRNEITSHIEKNGGEMTYDLLKKMTYLEMALKETLRKYPLNGGILFRKCNENYKIPESDVVIEKGTLVIIPMTGIQTDKKYFEKPDEFYPEHFTKEAISQRSHFTYLPFGEGPRVCIAERFANMQVLMGAVYLLKDFSFEVSPKTIVPLEIVATGGGVMPLKGGIWLKCQPL